MDELSGLDLLANGLMWESRYTWAARLVFTSKRGVAE